MKFLLTFISIILANFIFAQKTDFSDKLYCVTYLDSTEIEITRLELISTTRTVELIKEESHLFSFPKFNDDFQVDSITVTIDDRKFTFSAKNVYPKNLMGRTMTLNFSDKLDFDCVQIENKQGDVIRVFEPDSTCDYKLLVQTNSNDCLVKFKDKIIRDCALKEELYKTYIKGKPARYE